MGLSPSIHKGKFSRCGNEMSIIVLKGDPSLRKWPIREQQGDTNVKRETFNRFATYNIIISCFSKLTNGMKKQKKKKLRDDKFFQKHF